LPYVVGEPVVLGLSTGELPRDLVRRTRPDLLLEDMAAVTRLLAARRPVLFVTNGSSVYEGLLREAGAPVGATAAAGTLVQLGDWNGCAVYEAWPD
jgi:hypothetical protein